MRKDKTMNVAGRWYGIWCGVVLAGCAATASSPAMAQDAYPSRLIKIVVPFPAGTTADAIPRIVAERLSTRWSQPIIVENRPGATGNIGAEIVAKADPDGYTLLSSAPPPLAINQSLYPKLGYDASKFVPISSDGRGAERARGQSGRSRRHARRVGRAREIEARRAELRVDRARRHAAAHDGDAQARQRREAA